MPIVRAHYWTRDDELELERRILRRRRFGNLNERSEAKVALRFLRELSARGDGIANPSARIISFLDMLFNRVGYDRSGKYLLVANAGTFDDDGQGSYKRRKHARARRHRALPIAARVANRVIAEQPELITQTIVVQAMVVRSELTPLVGALRSLIWQDAEHPDPELVLSLAIDRVASRVLVTDADLQMLARLRES